MHGEDKDVKFLASTGWQWHFCQHHGIHHVAVQGETLSANCDEGVAYYLYFTEDILSQYLSHQIFNADETGLNYKLLPKRSLTAGTEQRVDGYKEAKDRVTILACANVSGSIRLPLTIIGKSNRPRCFKNCNMSTLPAQ